MKNAGKKILDLGFGDNDDDDEDEDDDSNSITRHVMAAVFMSVNKVILVGNVGKDPEVRYLEKNVAVANFT